MHMPLATVLPAPLVCVCSFVFRSFVFRSLVPARAGFVESCCVCVGSVLVPCPVVRWLRMVGGVGRVPPAHRPSDVPAYPL